jgi:hypothetical protein
MALAVVPRHGRSHQALVAGARAGGGQKMLAVAQGLLVADGDRPGGSANHRGTVGAGGNGMASKATTGHNRTMTVIELRHQTTDATY